MHILALGIWRPRETFSKFIHGVGRADASWQQAEGVNHSQELPSAERMVKRGAWGHKEGMPTRAPGRSSRLAICRVAAGKTTESYFHALMTCTNTTGSTDIQSFETKFHCTAQDGLELIAISVFLPQSPE